MSKGNKHKLSGGQTCITGGEHTIKTPNENLAETKAQLFTDKVMF